MISTGPPLVTRERFVAEVADACERRIGYAAGKLGVSERDWLRYPIMLAREPEARRRRAAELVMTQRGLRAAGVFPAQVEFYRRWVARHVAEVAQLDSIGVHRDAAADTRVLLERHGLDVRRAIDQKDQQPDRSSPSEETLCYLPAFRGRHVLLVCPFAELLADRASRGTFEAVWAKTGKRWFHPASVQALELPYGFAPATQERFGTALDLLADVEAKIAARRFDVALIAAGGLGIPLASFVKRHGRVGLSLGGHLQVVFGVLGARWRTKESWRRRYFNDAWVDLPPQYVPDPGQSSENYW